MPTSTEEIFLKSKVDPMGKRPNSFVQQNAGTPLSSSVQSHLIADHFFNASWCFMPFCLSPCCSSCLEFPPSLVYLPNTCSVFMIQRECYVLPGNLLWPSSEGGNSILGSISVPCINFYFIDLYKSPYSSLSLQKPRSAWKSKSRWMNKWTKCRK